MNVQSSSSTRSLCNREIEPLILDVYCNMLFRSATSHDIGKFPVMKHTFLRFAAVFVSFWQNPQTLSHFAIDRTPVVFHGGCRCPLLQVVLPNVPCSDIVRRARLRTGVCWRREEVIERAKGRCTWRRIRREDVTIALDIISSLSPLIHTKKKKEIR